MIVSVVESITLSTTESQVKNGQSMRNRVIHSDMPVDTTRLIHIAKWRHCNDFSMLSTSYPQVIHRIRLRYPLELFTYPLVFHIVIHIMWKTSIKRRTQPIVDNFAHILSTMHNRCNSKVFAIHNHIATLFIPHLSTDSPQLYPSYPHGFPHHVENYTHVIHPHILVAPTSAASGKSRPQQDASAGDRHHERHHHRRYVSTAVRRRSTDWTDCTKRSTPRSTRTRPRRTPSSGIAGFCHASTATWATPAAK